MKAYIVGQAFGPFGIDNEALRTFGFGEKRCSNVNPGQPMPPVPAIAAESYTYCSHCQSRMHDSGGCIVRSLHMSKEIGQKLSNRCSFVQGWSESFGDRCMTPRPHVGTLLAQFEPSCSEAYRERFGDTMLLCRKTERLGVQYVGDYSARHCNYSSLRITNQPAYKHVVMHRTVGLIEPRCNTMPNGQWKYKTATESPSLVAGFYWQFNSDDSQFLNSIDVMRSVTATRWGWYKAIETAEHNVDKTTREYQEELRGQNAIDIWPRRNGEFVSDNVPLWSRYLLRHNNSAESFVNVPTKLPSSVAYARCTRQRLARHRGQSILLRLGFLEVRQRVLLSQLHTSPLSLPSGLCTDMFLVWSLLW